MSAEDQLLVGYRGDECLGVRTAREWAEKRGISVKSVLFMATPTQHRKAGAHVVKLYRVEVDATC